MDSTAPVDAGLVGDAVDPDETRTEPRRRDPWGAGSRIAGKYEILSRLGSGGFGTVYKVQHIHRKKYYALKVPHPEYAREETFRQRFEREIEAMERFVHADAVMIRDSGLTEQGWPYYTMDFIDGENLREVLDREGALSEPRALTILQGILDVLDVAHEHQIIHRDIKPDNVLLTTVAGRERVKVLDFGVAKLLDLVGQSGSITNGERLGTPRYMSPEQITGEELDPRSDLFSLGLVLYEMLTGKHPFAERRDPIRVTAAILGQQPVPPRERVDSISRGTNELTLAMLEKRPRRRAASAGNVLRIVRELLRDVPPAQPVERVTVRDGVPRGVCGPLVVRQETDDGERRAFLFFNERVAFGRANNVKRGIRNDILLRCLPCRTEVLDAENWQANLTLSHTVGALWPDGAAVVLEPDRRAKHGIFIGGVRSTGPARIQSDRCHVSVGDRVLELDLVRMPRTPETSRWDLSCLEDGRPNGLSASGLTGYSNPSAAVDSVTLRRANNWQLHEYHVVYRVLWIGSSAAATLRLEGRGVCGRHAAVIHEGGEVFLLPLECGVRARIPVNSATDVESVALAPHELLPILPGVELELGSVRLRVEAATDRDFKTT